MIDGNGQVPNGTNETHSIHQMLHWIGFTQPQRVQLFNDSIGSYRDISSFSEKDISDMETEYSRRTAADGRMNIGIRRTTKLQALINFIQDFRRTSRDPTIDGMERADFEIALETAMNRAMIRKSLIDQSDIKSKEATPGPLVSESKWIEWESKFVNYLSVQIGTAGVPLAYVVRENDDPDEETVFANFVEETISRAPLTGEYYDADAQTVYQALISFTTGQPLHNWIKNTSRYRDGRRSMQALWDHFAGEGNTSRRIAEADRIKESLHYKNERSMAFETFLTKCQSMFNIYEQEDEPMEEDAKIRFIFRKVQHPVLDKTIEALKATIATSPAGTITYTTAANHLSTAVSEIPEFLAKSRTVSALNSEEAVPKT